jgi:hypothetical protein
MRATVGELAFISALASVVVVVVMVAEAAAAGVVPTNPSRSVFTCLILV